MLPRGKLSFMSFKDCRAAWAGIVCFTQTHTTHICMHICNSLLGWSHSRNLTAGKQLTDVILKKKKKKTIQMLILAHKKKSKEKSVLRGDLSWKMLQKRSLNSLHKSWGTWHVYLMTGLSWIADPARLGGLPASRLKSDSLAMSFWAGQSEI